MNMRNMTYLATQTSKVPNRVPFCLFSILCLGGGGVYESGTIYELARQFKAPDHKNKNRIMITMMLMVMMVMAMLVTVMIMMIMM